MCIRDSTGALVAGQGQDIPAIKDVRHGPEHAHNLVAPADRQVPVLAGAEIEARIARQLDGAYRLAIVIRASAEFASKVEQVAGFPLEAARKCRRPSTELGDPAEPDRERRGRMKDC